MDYQALAQALAGDWQFRPDSERGGSYAAIYSEAEGLHVWTWGSAHNGRLVFHVSISDRETARQATGYWYFRRSNERPKTEISVSAEKSPEAVAKDIARRLLPPGRALLAYAKRKRAQEEDYESKVSRNAAALRAAFPALSGKSDASLSFYRFGFYGDFRVNGDSVKVEVSCPVEVAVRIAALLAQETGGSEGSEARS